MTREPAGCSCAPSLAAEPTLDKPVTLFTAANLKALNGPPPDRPENLTVEVLDAKPLPRSSSSPIRPIPSSGWRSPPPPSRSPSCARPHDAVQAGATLLFSGRTMPLLEAYASWTGGKPVAEVTHRPDVLFEDFEHGYEKWQVEGEAFGKEPAHGTLPQPEPGVRLPRPGPGQQLPRRG